MTSKDTTNFKILVIEDNMGDYVLIEDFLFEAILSPTIKNAENFSEANQMLADPALKFDIIFLDLSLPDKQGSSLISEILSISNDIPVIALTGYSNIEFSVKSIGMGIADYLLKDELTAPLLYKTVLYNIERKKVLSALKESEKLYSDLFHSSPQPMWVYDIDTLQFLDVNRAAIKNYGYSIEEFREMTLKDIRPAEDIPELLLALDRDQQYNDPFSSRIFRHKKKDGTIFNVDIRSNIIQFKGRKAKNIIANDITERLKYIEAIENQNKALKEIAWIQSHEVRSPLSRILGLIQLFTLDDTPIHKQPEIIKMIETSAHELDGVIRTISEKANDAKLGAANHITDSNIKPNKP